MKKIFFLLISLAVIITIVFPNMDFYAYLVNLVENFPPILQPLEETMDLVRDFVDTIRLGEQTGTTVVIILLNIWQFLKILFEVLFVLPLRILVWAIAVITVLFGGAI